MKRIFIAGTPENTVHYRNAFTHLHVRTDTFPITPSTAAFALPAMLPDISLYQGLLLPGGGDIDPLLFGMENQGSRRIDAALDRLQLAALAAFLEAGKPVLGICKGLQLINVYFGGTILQDLPASSRLIHMYEDGDKIHETKAAPGNFISRLYGRTPVTNSAHHQGVGSVGNGLFVAQYGIDFVIEAMYHKSLPVFGVQWHPERMCFAHARPHTDDGSLLLRYFITLLK